MLCPFTFSNCTELTCWSKRAIPRSRRCTEILSHCLASVPRDLAPINTSEPPIQLNQFSLSHVQLLSTPRINPTPAVLSDFLQHLTNHGWGNGKNNMQEKAHPGNRDPVLAVAVARFSGVTNWMKVSINSGNPSNWSSWKSLRICEEHHSVSTHGRRQYSNIFIECIAALHWQ